MKKPVLPNMLSEEQKQKTMREIYNNRIAMAGGAEDEKVPQGEANFGFNEQGRIVKLKHVAINDKNAHSEKEQETTPT